MAVEGPEDLALILSSLALIPTQQTQPPPPEPDCLAFNPPRDKAWLRDTFDRIPRYLFRVSTPTSDGTTDDVWARSRVTKHSRRRAYTRDLMSMDESTAANMLNLHLRWKHDPEDNLVSWSSSLMFAIQYIIYRHKTDRPNPALSDLQLYIIDTSKFEKGVFLRDIDLIDAFSAFDDGLDSFGDLRRRKHASHAGSFYFGEYLSQDSLRIEGRCKAVSADKIVNSGLYSLRPEFQASMAGASSSWANEVIRLREVFFANQGNNRVPATAQQLKEAVRIADEFGTAWRIPVAAHLLALQPRDCKQEAMLEVFRHTPFRTRALANEDINDLSQPGRPLVASSNSQLPEVQLADEILKSILLDIMAKRVTLNIRSAVSSIKRATDRLKSLKQAIGPDEELEGSEPLNSPVRSLAEYDPMVKGLGEILAEVEKCFRQLQITAPQPGVRDDDSDKGVQTKGKH
ncbi:hypothetical protein B0T17DRAFT_529916 [Bombardia bombarda]|uniref:DUF7587 domain-containing protein n=1 Tax=Bombardia bombarda TaxID=252184 RepID=A0AA40CAE5_9PEZI|nr:hypothetical protein B0T17DRAFT_529916 [Bombardia bombarda]